MKKKTVSVVIAGLLAGALTVPVTASAEGTISIAQQFGIGYLLLDVVRDQHLIEEQGKKKVSILKSNGGPYPEPLQ